VLAPVSKHAELPSPKRWQAWMDVEKTLHASLPQGCAGKACIGTDTGRQLDSGHAQTAGEGNVGVEI
jgi:hypothetical protein